MCSVEGCKNSLFSGGKCLRHYRYEHYGTCKHTDCHSPACAKHGECDNCRRRGPTPNRHYGKFINSETHKWCSGCEQLLLRSDFYIDRGNSAYLCKKCAYRRGLPSRIREAAWQYGVKYVKQTSLNLCVKCWKPLKQWEVDHITPQSKGGTHSINNLQIMCVHCNREKSNNEAHDYRIISTKLTDVVR